jgi:hypothetical protein
MLWCCIKMRQGEWSGAFSVGSLPPIIVVAMAGGKDTNPADQEVSSKRPPWWGIAIAGLALVGMVGVISYGYLARPGWVGIADKKFWDYLELLIVPAALAIGVYLLNRRQEERDREADATREHEREATEEARRQRELEVENQRAQDEALQAYLDQMSQLLTDKDRPLHRAQVGDSLSTVARARTLTVLTRLDGVRKRSVLQFLYESGLITKDHIVVDLRGADLTDAHLERVMNLGENRIGMRILWLARSPAVPRFPHS